MVSRTVGSGKPGLSTAPWDVEQKNHGGVAGYALVPPYIWRSRYFSKRSMEKNHLERMRIEQLVSYSSVRFFTKKWHAERWVHEHYESEDAPKQNRMLSDNWKKNGWEWGYVPIRFAVVPNAIDRKPRWAS